MNENLIYDYFEHSFDQSLLNAAAAHRRIGPELKFPLVREDGSAASYETVRALWLFLQERGWEPFQDSVTGEVVGARKPGELNHSVASCETGYAKTEFSLAHASNLYDLEEAVRDLRAELRIFADRHQVHFLGFGIHPVSSPARSLLMKKGRAGVFDRVLCTNRCIPEQEGHDVHLFTINAASHVHVSVDKEEAVPAVNVLNGFSSAQIALTAHSNIWRGKLDPDYKCVAEKFWDWWMPESQRVGVPDRPFADLEDYVKEICRFRPIYVKRAGKPIILDRYQSFDEYYGASRAKGIDMDGREVSFVPEHKDIDLHGSCYWYNARISRYYTVENRVNDQQPPSELLCVAALTLGLVEAMPQATEEIRSYHWDDLRRAREQACKQALASKVDGISLSDLARRMLELARLGLKKRGLGEEEFLDPLFARLEQKQCPADSAARLFDEGGIKTLLQERKL